MPLPPDGAAMRDQIIIIIQREAEGLFDDPEEMEDLQVTVRIVCKFFVFLRESVEVPDYDQADYMLGTIRSGMRSFLSMHGLGRVLSGLKLKYGFSLSLPKTFAELNEAYNASFQQLLDCKRSIKAFGLMLSCVQMMYVFMAAYFPSFSSFSEKATTD
jgi:hypothetical protein